MRTMKTVIALLFRLTLALGIFGAFGLARAQELTPDGLVKNVTREVLEIVRKDKEIQSGNSSKMMELIEAKVLPHFNFTHMTELAVARDWRQADAAQRKTLIDEFRLLLVRTYSKSLTEYKDQEIEVKPLNSKAGETDVQVRTEIKQPGGRRIKMEYWLEKVEGGWKVYDIVVEGISLVTNYRGSFSSEVRNGGIDGLIKSLQAKNKTGAAATKK